MTPELLAAFYESIATLQNNEALSRSIAGQVIGWDPVEAINVGHRRQTELITSFDDAAWERRAIL